MSKKSKQCCCCEDEKKGLGPTPVPGFGDPNKRNDPARMAAIQKTRERVAAIRQNAKPKLTTTVKSEQVAAQDKVMKSGMYHVVELVKGGFDMAAFDRENPVYGYEPGENTQKPKYKINTGHASLEEGERKLTKKRLSGIKQKPDADSQANTMSVDKEGEWKSIGKKKSCCKKGLSGLMNVAKGL